MNQDCVPFVVDCHVRAGIELINHTWDPLVLTALRLGPTRRRELLERLPGASDKVLTESLRRLAGRALIAKNLDTSAGGAAIYELSDLGSSLANGPLLQLAQWAEDNQMELATTS
jgi:DNA-binding HxlR family transcriptional regulator